MELNRRREILYAPEVAHMAIEATVRNSPDIFPEGAPRTLRATRKDIMRESLSVYALLPREDGRRRGLSPTSFDVVS